MVGVYRKVYLDIGDPRWACDGGLGFPTWDTPIGRLSALICGDARYFEAARIMALQGADVVLFPTNWVDDACPSSWWMTRAFENQSRASHLCTPLRRDMSRVNALPGLEAFAS
ncbi:nitrilase-related carbon-nitrogen hydrolase [Dictyobacter formicarum]|uniref:CN hydrolase domain-containing protein n=1 Tax=Dictyobacter formicarum TaxID=2778368 RepID=A0ABQ3VNK4_9CHLR|nr:nitrilase-related carbon-nitrogen hydrolase [Dictyobacter formicarum]GHO87822.1 hypothetical protein KSZ_58280 [Dictyobacter formicarum]